MVVSKNNVARHARDAYGGGGVGGGVGPDNYKRCSCIEEECETLWVNVACHARDKELSR